ncbi:contactin-3-like isoform X2 [Ostrea edulis]|nr:contactin-3-like isoform X2 [Ostrea edulis]
MNWKLSFLLLLSAFICIIKCQDDQMPPKMTSTFNNVYYFPRDSILTNARIECKAQNGQIEYKWKKNGEDVQNSQYVSVDKSTGTLKFIQMQTSDYGTYQCFAKNDFGTSLSKPFKVEESRMGSFPSSDIKDYPCKEFEHCKIPCRDKPKCVPNTECRVEWKIGEGTKTNVEMTNRVGVDGDGDLHFLWSDTNDWIGLQYRCGIWQEQLKMLVVGSQTRLNIISASEVPQLGPISVYKSNGKALYRGVGVLRCMFSGYPAPDIEWVSPDKQVIKNSFKYEISDYGRILKIKDAEQTDEGFYLCNGKGKTESSQRVFLNVTYSPILNPNSVHPQMNDIYVPEGKAAKFFCEAVSLPGENDPSLPTWKKNGADLSIDGNKYILSNNNEVLTVTNVQKGSDSGAFQCMSENSEGVLFKEALLKVIDPIKIIERPLGNYKLMPGDMLSLGIIASSEPSLSLRYKWLFINHEGKEEVVKDNAYWKISRPQFNNLTIDVSQVSDPGVVLSLTGQYVVEIFHNYDMEKINVTVETEIISTIAPRSPIVQQANLNFLIYIAVAVVFLIVVIIIVFCLVRRNQGGVYSVDKKEVAAGHDPEKELLESGFQDLSRA